MGSASPAPWRELALATLLALTACTQPDATPSAGPRLAVEGDADLGEVPQGAPLEYTFEMRNDGGRPLRFEALRTACDCTAAATPADVLAPGAAGTIQLTCDSGGLGGKQRRTVTVYSNDASDPALTLALEAEVAAVVALQQREFYFGNARRGARTARDIRLAVEPGSVLRLARSLEGHFNARLEKRSDEEWRVALTVAAGAPVGVVEDRIEVETTSARQPRLVIPVLGRVEGAP